MNKSKIIMWKTRGFLLTASLVLAMALTFSCSLPDDKQPDDDVEPSSSSDEPESSSSEPESSSSVVPISSSVVPSSSSAEPSSSSEAKSSSSVVPSSSSVVPSSSSAEPSSSSLDNQAQWVWSLDSEGAQVPSQGYWFGYGDEDEHGADGNGGCSSTNFPPSSETEDIVTDAWKDLGGTITYNFDTNCDYKYRYAGFGFDWFDGDGTKLKISDKGDPTGNATGIRLKYTLTADPGLNCVIEIVSNGVTGYNNYTSALIPGSNLDETFPFSSFEQAVGWGVEVTWPKAWQASEGVKFQCWAGDPYTNGAKQAALTIDEISFVGQII